MSQITSTLICNEALVFLGEEPLLTFPEESDNSDRCAIYYETTVEKELKKHPWNFAKFRAPLIRDTASPDHEYTYQYILPPGSLMILGIYPTRSRWRVENTKSGKRLLCNLDTVSVQYLKRVAEGQFPAEFASLVASRLALQLANTMTERPEKMSQAFQWYTDILKDAKRVDSHESSTDQLDDLDVVENRFTGNHAYFYRPVDIS